MTEVVRLEGLDWEEARRLCCETADGGQGAAPERCPFFGEYWIGPYQRLLPQWSYAAKSEGRLAGYLTGCPDTGYFLARRGLLHRAPLFFKTAAGLYGDTSDTRSFLDEAKGLSCAPRPDAELSRLLSSRYPAHLHVNVDAGFRGQGLGRALVDRFLEDLRRERAPGVHLVCGPAPLAFYAALGFSRLGELRAGLFLLGRSLPGTTI